MKIYSLYDVKTRTYNRPFFEATDIVAIRNLRMEVNRQDANNVLFMFPEDYQLYKIGEYDGEKGAVSAQTPELVATCDSLVNAKLTEKTTGMSPNRI